MKESIVKLKILKLEVEWVNRKEILKVNIWRRDGWRYCFFSIFLILLLFRLYDIFYYGYIKVWLQEIIFHFLIRSRISLHQWNTEVRWNAKKVGNIFSNFSSKKFNSNFKASTKNMLYTTSPEEVNIFKFLLKFRITLSDIIKTWQHISLESQPKFRIFRPFSPKFFYRTRI